MLRTALRIVTCLLAVLLLAGCGGRKGQAPEATQPPAAPQETETPSLTAEPDAEEEPGASVFAELTGIPAETSVMRVGEREVSAELYFYWLCYVCSSLEYNIIEDYNRYGLYASCIDTKSMTVDWTSKLAGLPLMEYARAQTEDTVKYYMSVEELAEENGVSLTEKDRADMEAVFEEEVARLGGPKAFSNYLRILGISRESFDRISAASYLYDGMLAQVLTAGMPLFLPDAEYDRYAKYADHILIATQNMQNGEQLTPAEVLEKYRLAEELLSRLRGSEDPEALFAELRDAYSEDPGRNDHPDGYVYTPGTMVPAFESAVSGLEVGEISGIVQSDYGFHIILRRDLGDALKGQEGKREEIAKAYLDGLLVRKRSDSPVTYDARLEGMDWIAFYNDYIEAAERIASEG